ncbi:hypothetical protein [Candidatus Burkholderia verschuerenii]|uniref:hypothetical protein n=1 Tax=Candidatus Burkholderia verschuerenii TaxID=242163 RepID=UPI0018DCDC2C
MRAIEKAAPLLFERLEFCVDLRTAFGVPLEPDVYMTNEASSGIAIEMGTSVRTPTGKSCNTTSNDSESVAR